jgi:hypothetical protein
MDRRRVLSGQVEDPMILCDDIPEPFSRALLCPQHHDSNCATTNAAIVVPFLESTPPSIPARCRGRSGDAQQLHS